MSEQGMGGVSQDRVREWYDNPSAFVRDIVQRDPHDYQQRFLDADNSYKCFVAGRQVGKSLTLCWLALHKFSTRKNHTVLIFSRTERQALELFDGTLKAEMDHGGEQLKGSAYDREDHWNLEHETKHNIDGSNGSRIVALPAAREGTTLRGYTADTVIVDEAAHIEDNFFTEIVGPMMITTNGDFIIASTPWGRDGYFYDKFRSERWYDEQISSYDYPTADEDFIENELASGLSSQQYQQEILGEFPPTGDSPFPPTLVKPCFKDSAGISYTGNSCFLGVDLSGAGADRTVFCSIDDNGNVFNLQNSEDGSIKSAIKTIHGLNQAYGYDQILVDETSLGQRPVEELEEDLRNVEGFIFSLKSRASAYNALKLELEKQNLTLPEGIDEGEYLYNELTDLQVDMTPRDKMKFQHPEGGFDDHSDALALSVWAWREGGPIQTSSQGYSFRDTYSKDDGGPQAHSFN